MAGRKYFPSQKGSSDLKFQSYKHMKLDKKNFLKAILREQSVTMLKGKYIVGRKINFGFSSALRDELEIELVEEKKVIFLFLLQI